jgi:hypothetical protein
VVPKLHSGPRLLRGSTLRLLVMISLLWPIPTWIGSMGAANRRRWYYACPQAPAKCAEYVDRAEPATDENWPYCSEADHGRMIIVHRARGA